jgi:NO-binding membrane sensor protein with MHYT domain
MMAFRAHAPVVLDPLLTLLSLLAAIGLAVPGLAAAASRKRWGGLAGGGIVGIAISLMHYLGMSAYRVDGIVTWAWGYVVA